MLPSHCCVPAIIEGVFLPRNSIPRIGIHSHQKWERISSTFSFPFERKLEVGDIKLKSLEARAVQIWVQALSKPSR